MARYSILEQRIAGWLSQFPRLKTEAKRCYQRLNYWCCPGKGTSVWIHPDVSIMTLAEWAGTEDAISETFFGYFDKAPWSFDGNAAVFHEIRESNAVDIVVYDRRRGTRTKYGESMAWNTQQGSMAQWLPWDDGGSIIYNCIDNRRLVSRIVRVGAQTGTVVPWPVQAVHPRDARALCINYRRLHRLRVEYGYDAEVLNFSPHQALDHDGIWGIDLATGGGALIITIADLLQQDSRDEFRNAEHKINHVLYSPDGSRFLFMHRWIGSKGKRSRLYVASANGTEIAVLLDDGMVSHYSWRDNRYIIVYARTEAAGNHYYLVDTESGVAEMFGGGVVDRFGDGHPTYSPDRQWIVTDTYPDRARRRHILLLHVPTGRLIEVGRFFEPWPFYGPTRCDLHPRWSPDGKMISMDSAHTGRRMTYLLDVAGLVAL